MPFNAGAVVGTIELKYDGAVKALTAVQQQTQRTMAKMSAHYKENEQNINALTKTMAGVGVAIGAMAVSFVKASMENESSIIRLEAAIKATGQAIDSARLSRLAEDLQKVTPFTDEATRGMMAVAAAMGFNQKQIEELTPRVQNLASIFGMDLESAVRMLGRTILGGSAQGLRRMGIILDETVVKTKNFDAIMREVDKHSAGAAQRIGSSTAGAFTILKNEIGEVAEEIGGSFLPQLRGVIALAKDAAESIRAYASANKDLRDGLVSSTTRVGELGLAIGGISLGVKYLGPVIKGAIAVMSGPAGWTVAIAAVAAAIWAAMPALDAWIEKSIKAADVTTGYVPKKPKGTSVDQSIQQALPPDLVKYYGKTVPEAVKKAELAFTQAATASENFLAHMRPGPDAAKQYEQLQATLKASVEAYRKAARESGLIAGPAPLAAMTVEDYQKARKRIEDLAALNDWSITQQIAAYKGLRGAYALVLKSNLSEAAALHTKIKELEDKSATESKQRITDKAAQTKQSYDDALFEFEAFIKKQKSLGKALPANEIAAGYRRIEAASRGYLSTAAGHQDLVDLLQRIRDVVPAVAEADTRVTALKKRMEELADELKGLKENTQSYVDVQQELNQATEAYNKAIGPAQIAAVETRVTALRQRYAELATELTGLTENTQSYADATAELAKIQAEIDRATGPVQLVEVETRVTRLRQRISELTIELSGLKEGSQGAADVISELTQLTTELNTAMGPASMVTPWQQTMLEIQEIGMRTAEGIRRSFENAIAGILTRTSSMKDFLMDVWGGIAQYIAQVMTTALLSKATSATEGEAAGGAEASGLATSMDAFASAAQMLPGPLGTWAGAAIQTVAASMVEKAVAVQRTVATTTEAAAAATMGAAGVSMNTAALAMVTPAGMMAGAASAMTTAAKIMMAAAVKAASASKKSLMASIVPIALTLLQHGGIVTKPTLAMVGEAGPEAVIPLNQMAGMGGGSFQFGPVNLSVGSLDELSLQRLMRRGMGAFGKEMWRRGLRGNG